MILFLFLCSHKLLGKTQIIRIPAIELPDIIKFRSEILEVLRCSQKEVREPIHILFINIFLLRRKLFDIVFEVSIIELIPELIVIDWRLKLLHLQ